MFVCLWFVKWSHHPFLSLRRAGGGERREKYVGGDGLGCSSDAIPKGVSFEEEYGRLKMWCEVKGLGWVGNRKKKENTEPFHKHTNTPFY